MPKIKKNEAYSKLMLTEGDETPVDNDPKYPDELPAWADDEKIRIGQRFFFLNFNAMIRALTVGFIAIAATPTILKILMFTKQSSTPALAYRRFRVNFAHGKVWYFNPIKHDTDAWRSLEAIRKMHVAINRRVIKTGMGIISQKDMSMTLFLFMGFNILMPDKFGIVGTSEQFEAFNHFWRVIGYMLGMHDKFNCCGETLDDTLGRLEAIREDMILPALMSADPEYESYTKISVDGFWYFNPLDNHYDSLMFIIKRAIGVPGYHYFTSEAIGSKEESQKIFQQLSTYTKFKIFLNIVIYEYLSHYFIFRWIFNTIRGVFSILEFYPILAITKFGKKYAYVDILKPKN